MLRFVNRRRVVIGRRRPGRYKLTLALGALVLTLGLVVAACGGDDDSAAPAEPSPTPEPAPEHKPEPAAEPLKVAAIYLNKYAGTAYGQSWLNAFAVVKEELGIDVDLVENVGFDEKMTQTTDRLLGSEGYDVVIDTINALDLFYDACKNYPDQHCLELSSSAENAPPNTGVIWLDTLAPNYVMGVAAGLLTTSGTVGFVAPFKAAGIYPYINAFALGCQSVRPDCEVQNIYVNSFFDPPAEIEATDTLINAGADVINHIQDDQATLEKASERDAWGFATYLEPPAPLPEKYVTTALWEVPIAKSLITHLTAITDGTWNQEEYLQVFGSPEPADTPIGPWGPNVPADVAAQADEVMAMLSSGESPFTGPIYDASGELRVEPGVTLSLRDPALVSNWDWAVQGLTGG